MQSPRPHMQAGWVMHGQYVRHWQTDQGQMDLLVLVLHLLPLLVLLVLLLQLLLLLHETRVNRSVALCHCLSCTQPLLFTNRLGNWSLSCHWPKLHIVSEQCVEVCIGKFNHRWKIFFLFGCTSMVLKTCSSFAKKTHLRGVEGGLL